MTWLSDAAVARLREVADRPDATGTKYDLAEPLGHGGMGTVYRAFDRELGRDVALKVLTIPEAGPALAARMRQEARILARLEHPGIVPVHDVGTLADGRVYYTMKLVRGAPLDAAIRDLDSRADRLRIFQRICEAVAFAHAQGVVHRDLKPQNVMVGRFGEVLVLDWGVAKVLADPAAARTAPAAERLPGGPMPDPDTQPGTAHGTVIGTPGYMAPEQERGDVAAIDERTDVFALGAILRFLLTAAGSRQASETPRPLAAIWTRALAADAGGRYASASELVADITRFLEGQPVTAYPERLLERAARFARKYRVAILVVAAYLIMRALLLVVAGV